MGRRDEPTHLHDGALTASERWKVAAALLAASAVGVGSCVSPDDDLLVERAKVVYGMDDRVEYFDVSSEAPRALMADSIVALVPRSAVRSENGRLIFDAPTWGEAAGLCPGERFADETAAAFCTGVLVDWDLVLTAGHCVHLLALQDFWVVFGYHYDAPGRLAATQADLATPIAVVGEALDPVGVEPRLDYAWIRLAHAVAPPRQPVPVRLSAGTFAPGDPLVAIGAVGGTALKLDGGGKVRDARADQLDYFVADTDTAHGSSGGGAFDSGLALAGVLARGGTDFAPTESFCNTTVRVSDPAQAEEQFTYAARAVESLCRADPTASSLCRADCGEPCLATPMAAEGGCAVAGSGSRRPEAPTPGVAIVLVFVAAMTASVRERSRSMRTREHAKARRSARGAHPGAARDLRRGDGRGQQITDRYSHLKEPS